MTPSLRITIAAAAGALALAWGSTRVHAAAGNLTHGCPARFDAAVDYFPDKIAVQDAGNFTVEYHRSYKLVTVKGMDSQSPPERYVLVQCGTPAPALDGPLRGAQLVTIPVTSLFAASTTQLPLLVDLGRLDVLTGVSRRQDLVDEDIATKISTSRVREFASASVIDSELVVSSRPSVLMTDGFPNAAVSVIRQAGIPVVADIEWRESTALGRAEWLKFMAAFLNEEQQATARYAATRSRYEALRARASAVAERPLVMTGRSSRGIFTVAGGRSYVAALIKDAGGRYVWADNPSVGIVMVDLEAEVQRSANADIWINGGGWANRPAMLKDEPRYSAFKAYRDGQVWVYERHILPSGSNSYWSQSVSRPDLVLADLIKIFHPALLMDHAFEWYMPVPAR